MAFLALGIVYQQAGTVSMSFLLFAFVLSLLHLAFWHSWQVACKTCRTMCQARWINNKRHKHPRRISFCTNNTEVPYIASHPNTVRVVSSRFQQAFATSSYCHVKRKYFRVQSCSEQKDMKTHQWKSRMKHNHDKKCNSYLQCDFAKVVGNSTKADTSNIGSKFRQTWMISFLSVLVNSFVMVNIAKAFSLGWKNRRCRTVLQSINQIVTLVCFSMVPYFAICLSHHQINSFSMQLRDMSFHQQTNGLFDTSCPVKKGCIQRYAFTWERGRSGENRTKGRNTPNRFRNWVKNWKQWIVLLYLMCVPVGEATNPGPFWHNEDPQHDDFLWIGNANPTQLLNKEHYLSEWGQGIWTFSETSATERAIPTIRKRSFDRGYNVLFGAPVAPQQKATIMRGKAGGVATATTLPVKSYAYPMPEFLHHSTRFMDCVVQINNHQSVYVSTIYGVAGQNSAHPFSLTIDIFNQTAERALSFKGPAVICGDFNVPIESLEMWETLKQRGWFDAAYVDATKFQRELQPTSKHGSRHTYILMNRYIAPAFHSCRTSAHFEFDAHPLLVAGFNLEILREMRKEWVLPKSFDTFMFDTSVILQKTAEVTEKNSSHFFAALQSSNMNEAAKQFTLAVEDVLKNSAVDCQGEKVIIPPGHFGRAKGKPFRVRQTCVPCIKPGRRGDFNPMISQTTSSLRYHTKQLRRLTSLINQVKALQKNPIDKAIEQCQELWTKILNAQGFQKGFATWIYANLQCVVPLKTPEQAFLEELTEIFKNNHTQSIRSHYLANCSRAKIDLEIDIQKGGSRCFNDVKDTPSPPLEAIHWTEECEIPRVSWNKKGKTTIPVQQKPNFDIEYPVNFQGQKRYIRDMTPHRVTLDAPVTLKNSHDLKISQDKSSAKPADMHSQLQKFWASLWQRDVVTDGPNQQEGQWDEAISFVTCLSDCPTCPYQPITHELWFASLKGVKNKSARGSDGFSTRDFHMIRNQLLDWLLEIFVCIENGAAWPEQWSISKVTVLGKGSRPRSPLDIRPITILPKVYRLWSRLRSLEVLNHLKSLMPPEVAATSGGISADQIAAYTSCILEQTRDKGDEVCGLIIDLIKCYNTIPWEPCKKLLCHLGIPLQYQMPFFVFLKNLQRAFEVHGHCGEYISCTTGIPEGCAMSVAIMSALSWWCYSFVQHHHTDVTTIAYADNWGLIASTTEKLFGGTGTLFKFVEALKMKISLKKSWFWGSSKKLRSELRKTPPVFQEIPIANHAVDLGCDQNYTRKKICTKQKERIFKARRVLKRISKKSLPKRFRPTITQSAGFGVLSYGIELNRIPESMWSKLRTSTAGALGRNNAGSSPYLACVFNPTPVDPQLKAIIKTLVYWRRFFQVFPQLKNQFLTIMCEPVGFGPASNLAKSLTTIGWNPVGYGEIMFANDMKFNWVHCSKSFLRKIIKMYWSKHVASKIQHRKDFDEDSIDDYNMLNNIKHYSERQKSILMTYFMGSAFTADVTSKYTNGANNKCKICGNPDSRMHRLFHCVPLKNAWHPDEEVILWLQSQSDAWKQLAVMPLNDGVLPLLSVYQLDFGDNCIPPHNDATIEVFCDGSAFWQDQPTCTIAGAAAIVTTSEGNLERIIGAQPLPGVDQSSYRAEVFGLLMTLQSIFKPRIYCDCQAAVDQLLSMVNQHSQNLPPLFSDHWDLWAQIWQQVCARPKNQIEVVKTKAHCEISQIVCPQLKWEAKSNNLVDEIAKNVVKSWDPIYQCASQKYLEICHNKQKHSRVCRILLRQSDKTFEGRTEASPTTSVSDFKNFIPRSDCCHLFPITTINGSCKFGDVFMDRVVGWASQLKWPEQPSGCVSLLELYIDFNIHTGTQVPVPTSIAKDRRVQTYLLRDIHPEAKVISQTLGEQSIIWARFLKWAKLNGLKLWGPETLAPTNCLNHVGYSLRAPAVASRPILVTGEKPMIQLKKLFHTPTGKIRSLNIAYHGNTTV